MLLSGFLERTALGLLSFSTVVSAFSAGRGSAWIQPLPPQRAASKPSYSTPWARVPARPVPAWRLFSTEQPQGSPEIVWEPDVPYGDQLAELELLGDEELLAKYREDRQKVNDQWQFNTFRDAQLGVWSGIWSEYVPVPSDEPDRVELKLVNTYKGRNTIEVDGEKRLVRWKDEVLLRAADGGPMEPVVSDEQEFAPDSFRADNGAMAVDNAFTMSVQWRGESGDDLFAADTWLRWKDMRTRVRFLYTAPPEQPFSLSRLIVIRERYGKAGPTCEEPELFGRRGQGIYDRQCQAAGDWELNFPGGLSLSFPPSIGRDQKATVTLDWMAGTMRYQGDRTFDRPDGSLASFAVTQIGAADSLVYVPEGSTPVPQQEQQQEEGGEA